jgi:hypothetical protein
MRSPAQPVVLGDAAMFTLGVSYASTAIVKELLVTDAGEGHVSLLVSSHVTTSPLASVELVYAVLLVPTLEPFSFHWYTGLEPPNCAVALNVTLVPVQMVDADALMEMLGFTTGFTAMVTLPVMLFEQPLEARLVATAV